MFTPPPSPTPFRTKHSTSPVPSIADEDGFLAVPLSQVPACPSKEPNREDEDPRHRSKLNTTRRIRWSILLVPAVLILITLSTRHLSHLAGLDLWSQTESVNSDILPQRQTHKREPSPDASSNTSSQNSTDPSQTVPAVPSSPPPLPTPFPQALDDSLSSNFTTQICQNFFLNMTSSAAFRSCRPFSLLFQTSSDFVLAQTNLTALNSIMWGTCNTNIDAAQCSQNMAWFANDLQQECFEDVKENNAIVMQTLKGLQTYDLYRNTACLADQSTNAYCYVEAVHNTSPADLYFYSLPLGVQLPATITPSCSPCIKSVMAQFEMSVDSNSALAQVYNGAASIANKACGAGFVQTTTTTNSAARGSGLVGSVWTMALVLGVVSGLVLW